MPLIPDNLENTKGGIANGGIANLCGSGNLGKHVFCYRNYDFTDSPKVPGNMPASAAGRSGRQRDGEAPQHRGMQGVQQGHAEQECVKTKELLDGGEVG